MRFTCTKCASGTDKGYCWVETHWCPISLEIFYRKVDILCRPCYLLVSAPQSMEQYAKKALEGVEEKVKPIAKEISAVQKE